MVDATPLRPRAIGDILSQPPAERHGVLATGLQLLVEHVEALQKSVSSWNTESELRGRAILESVMGEEAAKVLILLDVVRGGWMDPKNARRSLGRFSNHFARGMYQRVASINPGSFGEARNYIELLRPEFYLDGPTDADWIFRNEIEAARELAFYVDYVKGEEDHSWVTPSSDAYPSTHWPAEITTRLVLAMYRTGLLSEEGLDITAMHWRDVTVTDETSFGEHFAITSAVMSELVQRQLFLPTVAQHDLQYVAEHWPFPMHSIPVEKIKITGAELESQRARLEEFFWRQELGPIEY